MKKCELVLGGQYIHKGFDFCGVRKCMITMGSPKEAYVIQVDLHVNFYNRHSLEKMEMNEIMAEVEWLTTVLASLVLILFLILLK